MAPEAGLVAVRGAPTGGPDAWPGAVRGGTGLAGVRLGEVEAFGGGRTLAASGEVVGHGC